MTIQAAPACGRGLLRPMDGSGEIRAGFYYIKFEGGFQWGIFFLMSAWDAGRRWRLAEIKRYPRTDLMPLYAGACITTVSYGSSLFSCKVPADLH